MRTHPARRLSVLLPCLVLYLQIAPLVTAADMPVQMGPTSGDRPVPAAGDQPGEAPTVLADFKAAGAKLVGKKPAEAVDPESAEARDKGTSAVSARKEALAALPLDQITREQRERVDEILGSTSFYRRLPTLVFAVEPDVYTYFINHPDVAVSIWRAMKISKLQMWQTGKNAFEADAGDGTIGTMEVLHRGVEKYLVLCEGLYRSPLSSKPIKAKSLLMLQTSFIKEADGIVYATHRADLFVSFPSQTVEAVSKILSPLTVMMTDRTFCEVSLFLKMMSLAMSRRPDWVEQTVNKMDGVPELRRHQVLVLTAQVHTASQKKTFATSGAPAEKPATGDAPPRLTSSEERATTKQ